MAFIALLVSAFSCSQTVGDPPSSVTVAVDAQEAWQDTGLMLDVGDDVVIEYLEGQWTNWLNMLPFFGPDGGPSYVCSASTCVEPLHGYPQGGLIGRVGDGSPFGVGYHLEFTADGEGMLQMRMNDVGTSDNKGSVHMQITRDSSLECGLWLAPDHTDLSFSLNFTAGCV